MREFSRTVVGLFRRAASEQGGLLNGKDPTAYNPSDPIRLWIIQVGIIVCTASLLSLVLKKVRQPKVIAEVLGGILLGPTAFGRIPGFTEHIFPQDSRPYLSLVANIGLCLFLFLVGLEIDATVIKRNARLSATVALAGMSVPFGLGAALSIPLYHHFIDQNVQFTHFMLFTGVAYSITAFPVLCRILTELKLLDTNVGIVVLSAGVGNDIVGWSLLALSVALVNAGSGLMALWILLTCIGWTLFVLIPIKAAFRWLAKKTGSVESGPTVFFMTVTMMTLFGSAFVTDAIGVHAIFGAFLAGLIVPREGGLAIALTEKLEDMVAIIFLPLYFTLSGLSTDLGLLNDGITWGFTIAIMTLSFTGKFGGCTLAARYVAGFSWRDASTIGSLMSCKGLVELIVLNVGLSAGILSQRVFSMFVLEGLVLTTMTTPLVTWLYPPEYRVRIATSGGNFNNVADDEANIKKKKGGRAKRGRGDGSGGLRSAGERTEEREDKEEKNRFTIVLDRIEHLPGAMAIAQLINPSMSAFNEDDEDEEQNAFDGGGGELEPAHEKKQIKLENKTQGGGRTSPTASTTSSSIGTSFEHPIARPIINALRLIKLTDRVSAVMKSHDTSVLSQTDPLLSIFRMFSLLQGIRVFGEMDVVPEEEMAGCVLERAERFGADMVIVPWVVRSMPPGQGVASLEGAQTQPQTPRAGGVLHNPFDNLFKPTGHDDTATPGSPEVHIPGQRHGHHGVWNIATGASVIHSHYIRNIFVRSDIDVGLYIDQSGLGSSLLTPDPNTPSAAIGLGLGRGRGQLHIFLPFFGGPDDRLALEFIVGLCRRNEGLRATVLRIQKTEGGKEPGATSPVVEHEKVKVVDGDKDKAQRDRNEEVNALTVTSDIAVFPDTVYGQADTEMRLVSETADNITWARYTAPQPPLNSDSRSSPSSSRQIPEETQTYAQSIRTQRVTFRETSSPRPLHTALDEALALQQLSEATNRIGRNGKRKSSSRGPPVSVNAGIGIVVVTGRSRRLAVESHRAELKELMELYGGERESGSGATAKEARKTMGEVGSAFVIRGAGIGVLVVQAALNRDGGN